MEYKKACVNCEFYVSWASECRKKAPITNILVLNSHEYNCGYQNLAKWPKVDESDYCGEFIRNKEEE